MFVPITLFQVNQQFLSPLQPESLAQVGWDGYSPPMFSSAFLVLALHDPSSSAPEMASLFAASAAGRLRGAAADESGWKWWVDLLGRESAGISWIGKAKKDHGRERFGDVGPKKLNLQSS